MLSTAGTSVVHWTPFWIVLLVFSIFVGIALIVAVSTFASWFWNNGDQWLSDLANAKTAKSASEMAHSERLAELEVNKWASLTDITAPFALANEKKK